jgi:hypothetical protein
MLKRFNRLCLLLLLTVIFTVSCSDGDGGSTLNAVRITSAEEFYNIRDNLSGIYILTNDISLAAYGSGSGWEPIGEYSVSAAAAAPFTGILDGNGFKITDLYVDRGVAGLFGYIGNGARISNLTVEVSSSGVKGVSHAGGLAGIISGTVRISNVHIKGTGVIQAAILAGGIAGELFGNITLSSCGNTNTISTSYSVPPPTNPYSDPIVVVFAHSGGIAGEAHTFSSSETIMIKSCYNTGDVSSLSDTDASSGGIVGFLSVYDNSKITITDSYNTGDVSTSSYILSSSGGISGYVYVFDWEPGTVTVMNSYNIGGISSLSSSNYTDPISSSGGIFGYMDGADGKITVKNNAVINTEINATSALGTVYLGRIVGYSSAGFISTNNFALDSMRAIGVAFNTSAAFHGINKTERALKTRITYESAVKGNGLGGLGWLFGNNGSRPWKMPPSGGYPILYWQ